MKKLLNWQLEIIERTKKSNNEEILDALLEAAMGSSSDYGEYRDQWEYEYLYEKFKEIMFS